MAPQNKEKDDVITDMQDKNQFHQGSQKIFTNELIYFEQKSQKQNNECDRYVNTLNKTLGDLSDKSTSDSRIMLLM